MAVAPRGDRGSQRICPRAAASGALSGGRPPGRPRIATASAARPCPSTSGVAVAPRGDRGSQPRHRSHRERRGQRVAVAPRGDRGSQRRRSLPEGLCGLVAVAPRGDRGSQHLRPVLAGVAGRPWRSPPGATEDRNIPAEFAEVDEPGGGRPPGRPRIATWPPTTDQDLAGGWRSPPGATEDRNLCLGDEPRCQPAVAVAPRGDRGSQLLGLGLLRRSRAGWRSPPGATEDRNNSEDGYRYTAEGGGGRPPGRPRIATTA